MSMPATSSMLERRVTMAFFSASLREPSAIVATLTTGIAIGIDATSSTTAKASATSTSSPSRTVSTSSEMKTSSIEMASSAPVMRMSTIWKWPCSLTDAIIDAVLPKKVCEPVAMTIASASPRVTLEPILGSSPATRLIAEAYTIRPPRT